MINQDFVSDPLAELHEYYETGPPMMVSRIDTVVPLGPDGYGPHGVDEYADSSASSSSSRSNSFSNLDPRPPSFTSPLATSIPEDPTPKESNSILSRPAGSLALKKQLSAKLGGCYLRKNGSSHMLATRGKAKGTMAEYKWNVTSKVDQKVYSTQDTVADRGNHIRDYLSTRMDTFMVQLDNKIQSRDERSFVPKQANMPNYPVYSDEDYSHNINDKAFNDKSSKSSKYISKVHFYENSRLPASLPQFTIDSSEYPLIRLAAQYSHQTYVKSKPESHKAIVVGCADDKEVIVLAIRGTASLKDWAVNMDTEPKSPKGFLDDSTNLVHGGFLSAAKKMIQPIAAQLRALIAENIFRQSYSLLITGHSAGAAIAGLLYCHMLSTKPDSELACVGSYFRRIHCITFGAPPSTERPLYPTPSPDSEQSLFYAFINEGDPVPRADKAYMRSLLSLYASPTPGDLKLRKYDKLTKKPRSTIWQVPPAPLSLAGHLVVLRNTPTTDEHPMMSKGEVEACVTSDSMVRRAIFGDPGMHPMTLYSQRIDALKNYDTC
ncbi:alpha/beta-hydrolase [Penicillium lagena]|uniref:alpha/beta-hydrolase n=1 Tax=Penicillium lagena TaxID=94218 RepID=UPI0025425D0B|nr:alpha/beta-hydrolase [Penicillium lagena]KAJ5611069.1 alpha/beta-hydrolase [Penicillium lagena]